LVSNLIYINKLIYVIMYQIATYTLRSMIHNLTLRCVCIYIYIYIFKLTFYKKYVNIFTLPFCLLYSFYSRVKMRTHCIKKKKNIHIFFEVFLERSLKF
jgi:hypothetical protein